jgi:phosphonate transport system permease protein
MTASVEAGIASAAPRWRPPSIFGGVAARRVAWGLALVYLVWSVSDLSVDWARVAQGLPRALDLLVRMFPPDFGRWELLLRGMTESLQMAIAATLFGALLSIPLGLCAAANLAPRPVYVVARGLLTLLRSFHEVIIAIFFVKIFGFGPVAGLLTLILASAVFLAKTLAEDIENMRPGSAEAIRATGASFAQLVLYAIVPQVLSRTLGVWIYRLDANLRHSTVVGIVGAGGIGQTLSASFSRYDFDFSLAILLSIAALVALGEWFSDWLRSRLQ